MKYLKIPAHLANQLVPHALDLNFESTTDFVEFINHVTEMQYEHFTVLASIPNSNIHSLIQRYAEISTFEDFIFILGTTSLNKYRFSIFEAIEDVFTEEDWSNEYISYTDREALIKFVVENYEYLPRGVENYRCIKKNASTILKEIEVNADLLKVLTT